MIILFHLSFNGYSQILELKELKMKRLDYELEIERLQTELSQVNKEISFIENQYNSLESQEWVIVKAYAELYERASFMSPTIGRFKTESKVLLLGSEDDYINIKSQLGTGFVKIDFLKSEKSSSKSTTKSFISNTEPTYTRKSYQTSKSYIRGPKGGCYYINGNGNKSYVDRSLCN